MILQSRQASWLGVRPFIVPWTGQLLARDQSRKSHSLLIPNLGADRHKHWRQHGTVRQHHVGRPRTGRAARFQQGEFQSHEPK
jgi:hypothetical protein